MSPCFLGWVEGPVSVPPPRVSAPLCLCKEALHLDGFMSQGYLAVMDPGVLERRGWPPISHPPCWRLKPACML